MSQAFLIIAAVLSGLIAVGHVLAGGRTFVPTILGEDALPQRTAWLAYFSWHVGTVALLACAGAFAYAANVPDQIGAAIFASITVTGFAFIGLGMALMGGGALFKTPAPYVFWLVGAAAWAGVATA